MNRLLPLVCLSLATVPALAQQLPIPPLRSPGEQMRSFLLANWSGQVITAAEANMTDGKHRVLIYAPLQPGHAQRIVLPRKECLDSVVVYLNDGQSLRANHMDDCKDTPIEVARGKISLASNPRR